MSVQVRGKDVPCTGQNSTVYRTATAVCPARWPVLQAGGRMASRFSVANVERGELSAQDGLPRMARR